MTNAEWWSKVKQPVRGAEPLTSRPRTRLWTLRRDRHEATLDLRIVPAMGPELVLSVDGDLRRSRLYGPGDGRSLARSIIAMRGMFAAKGWAA